MKNILIFYAKYGGGHYSVAKSIKEELEEKYSDSVSVQMVDCIEYINKFINKLTVTAYKEMTKKFPWAWSKVYSNSQKGIMSVISEDSNKIMAHKLNILIKKINPDIMISSHPFSTQMCTYLKKKNKLTAKIANILTDFAPHEQWLVGKEFVDYFFVAHEDMKKELINHGINENKIFPTGIPVSPRFFKEFHKHDIYNDFDLSENKDTVLFFAGGEFGLGRKSTYEILETLARDFDNLQIIAVAGKNKKMNHYFNEIVQKYQKQSLIKVLDYTNKVPELMSISKLIITKPGGITSSESLVSKVPLLIINPIPGQEEENAKYLENNGFAIWMKKTDSVSEILKNILKDSNLINKLKINIINLNKYNATEEICKIVLK